MNLREELEQINNLRDLIEQNNKNRRKLLIEMNQVQKHISNDNEIFDISLVNPIINKLNDLIKIHTEITEQFAVLFPDQKEQIPLRKMICILSIRAPEVRMQLRREKYTECLENIKTIQFYSEEMTRNFERLTGNLRDLDLSVLSIEECEEKLGLFVDYFTALKETDRLKQTEWVISLGGKFGPALASVIMTKEYSLQTLEDQINYIDPEQEKGGQIEKEADKKTNDINNTSDANNSEKSGLISQLRNEFSSKSAEYAFLELLKRVRLARSVYGTLNAVEELTSETDDPLWANERSAIEIISSMRRKVEECRQSYLRLQGRNTKAYAGALDKIDLVASTLDTPYKREKARAAMAQLKEELGQQLLVLYKTLVHYHMMAMVDHHKYLDRIVYPGEPGVGFYRSPDSLKAGEAILKDIEAHHDDTIVKNNKVYNGQTVYDVWTREDRFTDGVIRDYLSSRPVRYHDKKR